MFDDSLDRARMRRLQEGDAGAFEDLYRDYAPAIGAFFYRMSLDRTLAEDGLQEVFLRLWKASSQYRGGGKFSTYLFQIAKNYWLSVRNRQRKPEPAGDIGELEARGAGRAGAGADPHARLEGEEFREAAARAIASLPEEQGMCYILAEVEGMKYREIAEVLSIPLGTVKSRMGAAERSLRQKLKMFL